MACDCIEKIDAKLVERNTKLDLPIVFGESVLEQSTRVCVATTKADAKKRAQAVRVFATFCPFCGVEYKTETEQR